MPLKTLSEALVCSKQMFLSEHEEILKKKKNTNKTPTKNPQTWARHFNQNMTEKFKLMHTHKIPLAQADDTVKCFGNSLAFQLSNTAGITSYKYVTHLKTGKVSHRRSRARITSIWERAPYKEFGFIWVFRSRTSSALP